MPTPNRAVMASQLGARRPPSPEHERSREMSVEKAVELLKQARKDCDLVRALMNPRFYEQSAKALARNPRMRDEAKTLLARIDCLIGQAATEARIEEEEASERP